MYSAARLYYLEDATQADVAQRLGTSRATVSRLLSEARRSRGDTAPLYH
jgi:DNA-binding transcriptional regulator LsrR (DeoR family)